MAYYIRRKLCILRQMGCKLTPEDVAKLVTAKSEIRADQIAREIIFRDEN